MVKFYHFSQPLTCQGGKVALYMCALPNGSSSLLCRGKDDKHLSLYIFDPRGQVRQEYHYDKVDPNVLYGGVCFPNDSYAVFTQRELDSETITANGTFYFPEVNGKWREVKFDDIRVFENDWFALRGKSEWALYDNTGKVRADSGFRDVRVFSRGYALLNQPGIFDDEDVWSLYSTDDSELRKVKDVEDFVGDGFVIVKGKECLHSIQYFDRDVKFRDDFSSWRTFPGGQFDLTWSGQVNTLSRMYYPWGEIISCDVWSGVGDSMHPSLITFLPSGYYVVQEKGGNRFRLYNREGKEADDLTRKKFEIHGNYYMIGSCLYNAHARRIGSWYQWIGECGNFQIFARPNGDHLVYEVRNNDGFVYCLL